MLKEKVKRLTQGSILYSPLRGAYRFVFNRSVWKHRKQAERFYRQFVPKGALLFDIGAHAGIYTEMFLNLGARVVAVEPNPSWASQLKTIRPFDRVVVETVAIGRAQGEAMLFVCDHDTLSTMSHEWLQVAQSLPRLAAQHWNRTVRVPVTTLDALISKHGQPQFIKIDVEGYEREVLAGLSELPRFLSFEFITEYLDGATQCLRAPCLSASARFNMTLDHPFGRDPQPIKLALNEWIPRDQMFELLADDELRRAETYGEILVRND